MSISWILGGIMGGGNQQQNAGSQAQQNSQGAFINQAQQQNAGSQAQSNSIGQTIYYDAKKLAEEARWNDYLIKCNNVTKETK